MTKVETIRSLWLDDNTQLGWHSVSQSTRGRAKKMRELGWTYLKEKRGSMVKLRIADNDEGLTENIVYPELLN